jgi:hypothetical protein
MIQMLTYNLLMAPTYLIARRIFYHVHSSVATSISLLKCELCIHKRLHLFDHTDLIRINRQSNLMSEINVSRRPKNHDR